MGATDEVYDVIVVGAGPAGSVAAEALAQRSLRVALLEEHPQVGEPNHCSGLVSPRTLQAAGVAEEIVGLRRYDRARIWGPGGDTLWVRSASVQAIAIDRPLLDQILAGRAARAGADLMRGTKACAFERAAGHVQVSAQRAGEDLTLRARLLIGADGAYSRVARWMGGFRYREAIPAVKAEVAFRGPGTDDIEIFVGNQIAPGWFGWLIPVSPSEARIGVGTAGSLKGCFPAFCDRLRSRFGPLHVGQVRKGLIPLGPPGDYIADQVMLVGAAAGQTKPTTGGGVYLGVRAAQLAAETALRALERGKTTRQALSAYPRHWQRCEGYEVKVGHWLRTLFRRLSDRDLTRVIRLAARPWAQPLITRLGDMDYPSRLLYALLRSVGRRAGPSERQEVRQLAGEALR